MITVGLQNEQINTASANNHSATYIDIALSISML